MSRSLGAAMVRFAAALRRHGVPVTPEHVTDGVRALEHLDLADRDEVRTGLRAVFAGRPEDFTIFDRVFDAFWRVATEADRVAEALAPPALPEHAPPGLERAGRETLALEAWQDDGDGDAGDEPVGVPAASELEALAARDFSTFSPDQLEEVLRVTLKIARRLARRISRRRRPSARRGRIDLRRTLRANLTRGELIDLRYRRRKRKKVRLVLLCDVSGSMDLYSRFLLVGRHEDRRVARRVQSRLARTGRSPHDCDHPLRRLGHRRPGRAGRRAAAHQAPGGPRHLAQSTARQSVVRAAHAGDGRRAAARGPVRGRS
ncbi:MAG: hypothetical protein DME02_05395 [Candidatus Rokuibacteriota bacterium]|nr:MAG: hypothetical protein DME02_05395 [Candidatus Rokubacteria bacterium]